MKLPRIVLLDARPLSILSLAALLFATQAGRGDSLATNRQWSVDGLPRTALIFAPVPVTTNPAPVVFAFHGHGGNVTNAARSFRIHAVWPEAIVVYPQGVKTPGRLTDPEGKRPGWQHAVGDHDDRDLKFFDVMWANLQQDYRVDKKRVYATGHSNGGAFTTVVWAARGEMFAAFAPSAEVPARTLPLLKPKPVLHLSGRNDQLVKFEWQEAAVKRLRKLNQCGDGEPWAEYCTLYPSKIGAPVVEFFHPGGHNFPAAGPALIVKFFQQHALQ